MDEATTTLTKVYLNTSKEKKINQINKKKRIMVILIVCLVKEKMKNDEWWMMKNKSNGNLNYEKGCTKDNVN